MKNTSLRLLVLGFITWLVPFIISFGFYDRTGNLNVSYGLFKSVMIVTSSLTGMAVLLYHMDFVRKNFVREGLTAGMVWLIVNYLLDVLILIPMSGLSVGQYFLTIGLGYLQIPVTCLAVGMIVQRKILWTKQRSE